MRNGTGTVSFEVSPELMAALESMKQERYADCSMEEMLRCLIEAGLRASGKEA